ncbi:hypothetical protein [Kaistella yonginensis]|uniref:hypothetical protein n=1 Tax=Kaistella yonginensis TaxID=658267 RepID=UPI0025B44869|nr:hypothetical protein [Kaistella yonginensis]MDN3606418.1 hypothetical protein [Kaistella yonginensis]
MYYLELIQRFWDFNQRKSVGSTGIAMYLYLLKIACDNDRYDFQISDVAVSKELGLTRKTVKSTKEKLKNLGLIQFQTKNGLPCNYRLILDYPLLIFESKNNKKEEIKENFIHKVDKYILPSAMVSLVQTHSGDTNQEFEEQSLLKSLAENDKTLPSFEEFIKYAKTLEIYEPELDFDIKSKYEIWKNNGWKNSSDRPITNWKSSLKSTLPFMKKVIGKDQLSLQTIPNIKRPKSQNEN